MQGVGVKPPGGSVYQEYSQGGGPPMMRMIALQVAFGALGKLGEVRPMFKYLCIMMISFGFSAWDMRAFMNVRTPNVYERIGLHRQAHDFQIEHVVDMYKKCKENDPECDDIDMAAPIYELTLEDLDDIRYVLLKDQNRMLYDKTETFCRKGKEAAFLPSAGQ